MKLDVRNNAKRNIFFKSILKCYQVIIPFILRTVFLYTLGIEYIGLNSLFTSVLSFLNLAELGIGTAMVFSMYEPIASDDADTICGLMFLYRRYYRIVGIAILSFGCMLLPFIKYLISSEIPSDLNLNYLFLMYLGSTVLSYWLFAYKNCLLSAHQRDDITSKISLVINTFQYFVQIISLVVFTNFYLYVFIGMFAQICNNFITAYTVNKIYPGYRPINTLSPQYRKALHGKIRDLFCNKIGGVIVNSADAVIISAFLGIHVLGVYQNYYFILKSVLSFVFIIQSSCTSGLGNKYATSSGTAFHQLFERFQFLVFWINAVCVSCFLCMYQPFIALWAGQDNLLPFGIVILLCIYFYVFSIMSLAGTFEDSTGCWHYDRFRPLVEGIANLGMNLAFVHSLGLYGILLSTIISMILISYPWLIHNLYKHVFRQSCIHQITAILRQIVQICAISFVCWACNAYLAKQHAINSRPFLQLGVTLFLCMLLSNIILFTLHKNSDSFRWILSMLRK